MWQILADLVLAAHAAYVLFVVGGQALIVTGWVCGWEWTRHLAFRLLHLAAIALVMLEAWLGVHCPLTALENFLRLKTGSAVYAGSFVNHWLQWMIFYDAPERLFAQIYTVFTMLVVLTWLIYPPHGKLK